MGVPHRPYTDILRISAYMRVTLRAAHAVREKTLGRSLKRTDMPAESEHNYMRESTQHKCHVAAAWLTLGLRPAEVGRRMGISAVYVRRLMHTPEGRAALEKMRRLLTEVVLGLVVSRIIDGHPRTKEDHVAAVEAHLRGCIEG